MKRRTFIKFGVGTLGTGLLLGITYNNRFTIIQKVMNYIENKDFDANAFIFIQPNGLIKIICHRSEMGQGIRTALPMVIADELDVAWEQIKIIQADGDSKYGSQNTDGSKSIRDFYIPLRTAAAAAREMLQSAAAQIWGIKFEDCKTDAGYVVNTKNDQRLSYGDLVSKATTVPVPKKPKLKSNQDFNFIGKPKAIIDLDAIVTGRAGYGIDVNQPGLLTACLRRAPVPGAKVKSFDPTAALKVPGVLQVIELEAQGPSVNSNASVAVVAENTWSALSGRDKLQVTWDYQGLRRDNSKNYRAELEKSLRGSKTTYRSDGNIRTAKKTSLKSIGATYHAPYLVHAPMEPLVCTAMVTKNKCEVWAPCQDPQRSMKAIASLLNIDIKNIKFHVTLLGGGFGRKSQPDFVLESVLLAKKVGKPVKIQWSREDDIKHGFYHAESLQKMEAVVDKEGMPLTWEHKAAFPTIMTVFLPNSTTPADWEAEMGSTNMPYQIKNIKCEVGSIKTSLRIGWLRSVCNIWNSFAVNSFVDELAHVANADPIDYRIKLIGSPRIIDPSDAYPQDTSRLIKVIEHTRKEFGWDKPLPDGHGKGFANHYSFKSYVALALEAAVVDNVISVKRAVCTIDCGLAVNPESVRAQIEGAIIFGLSAALYGKITVKDGVVEQSNFLDYPVLRISESPDITIHILNGEIDKPTGVGEPGVPPVAPALAGAIFSATGKRLRDLPLRLS